MQQGGGSQYAVPPTEMSPPPYGISGIQTQILGIPSTQDQLQQNQHQQQQAPEAAPPISSRPPAATGTSNLEELATAMGVSGFPDDMEAMAAGEEADRGISGNRWPRQETLALLKIRSDMDAVFRDATLKGPLWEDVSRKLAEQGYTRSAKKCKEKFENVHKYYKRTKEKSGGRQDGKSYRFYSQLEALNSSTSSPATAAAVALPSPTTMNFGSGIVGSLQPTPLTTLAPTTTTAQPSAAANPVLPQPDGATLFSFSSNTWSSGSSSDSDGEDTEEGLMGEEQGQRKRKRGNQSSSGRKMRAFLKELMQQVLERQEVMQKRFFETIEKREQGRMTREEGWKRQEMARLNREHELMAQERAMSASRDASIIAFLQKITGQSIQLPQMPISVVSTPQPVVTINPPQSQQQPTTVISPPPPPPQQLKQHRATPSQHGKLQQQVYDTPGRPPPPPVPSELVVSPREQSQELGSVMGTSADPASSRWPKMEVHALIKVRSEMEPRYQENGPKGPLWEEISAAMQRMGYNRSSKRCKEKWENINKYFKKVKESSKKRPEDSKTCPYFHQLDALYRKKIIGSSSSGGGGNEQSSQQENDLAVNAQILPITTLPPASQQPQVGNVGGGSNGGGGSGGNSKEFDQMKTSNGDRPQSLSEEGGTGIKKPEDILKELMGRGYDDMEENDSDSMTIDDDEDDDEDEEQQKMAYKIEFQRSDMGNSTATTNNPGTASVTTTTTAGSFLAMVK